MFSKHKNIVNIKHNMNKMKCQWKIEILCLCHVGMAEIVRNIVSIDNTNIIIKITTQKYK